MKMSENVILVDDQDRETGVEEKLTAHRNGGMLHRAFSIFIFNSKGQMLLQKRADHKYHWGGFWTNSCCGHPRPGESIENAATRRLQEELGIKCTLNKVFDFIYRADFKNGLSEHEVDHVFIGIYDGSVHCNPEEVSAYKWVNISTLETLDDEKYTPWFKIALQRVLFHYNQIIKKKEK
jgi:isopentenyl-diphosphate delta-isomerase